MAPTPVIRARLPGGRIMRPAAAKGVSALTQVPPRTPATQFSLVRFVPGNKLAGYEYEQRPLCPLVLTAEDLGGVVAESDDETTHVSETEYDGEEEEDEEDRDGAQPDPLLMLSRAASSSAPPPRFPPAQLRPAVTTTTRRVYVVKDSDAESDGVSEEYVEEVVAHV